MKSDADPFLKDQRMAWARNFRELSSKQLYDNICVLSLLVEDEQWKECSNILTQIQKVAIYLEETPLAVMSEELSLLCKLETDAEKLKRHCRHFLKYLSSHTVPGTL